MTNQPLMRSKSLFRGIPEDGEGMSDEPRDGGREERPRKRFFDSTSLFAFHGEMPNHCHQNHHHTHRNN
jgi:hypothetical protein